jgi:hypothetical protein
MFKINRVGTLYKCPLFTALSFSVFMFSGCDNGPSKPADLDPNLTNIRLTEIHYNPDKLDNFPGDSLEFIEIKNIGTAAADLSDCKFTSGVDFTFPSGSVVPAGKFFVVASNAKAFKLRYGFDPNGVFLGQLKNSGETIELIDVASVEVLFSQTYSDTGAWPKKADGDGYSLVAVNPNPAITETKAENWKSSIRVHGSPGADDIAVAFDPSLYNLRITEINYHPDYTDSLGEDSLEFIELKNVGTTKLDLSDVTVTGGIEYIFASGSSIEPGKFIVLAAKKSWFKQRYGFDAYDAYKGQLKNSTETIKVTDRKSGTEIVSITFTDGNPWPSKPDGDGYTLVPLQPNPTREEQPSAASWRTSFRIHGSPGSDDPGVVLVNEVLPHTDPPTVDAIELYNPNKSDCNIGGWYLSDDKKTPTKFRIPDGTIIKAEGYTVFTADVFNKDSTLAGSFALSENGDDIYLFADTAGCDGYCHGFSFGAMERGVTYGRYIVPSTGNETFVPLANVTLGSANSGPLVGPLVVSEIMTHSKTGNADFIEITNIGNIEVPLYDQLHPDNTWRVQIDDKFFNFPKAISIKTGESVIISCGTLSADEFKTTYTIPATVQLFSYNVALADTSIKIELEKPMEPPTDSASMTTPVKIYYMETDKISYKNESPWPTQTAGSGTSLVRISNAAFGNDPLNWKVATPTPGTGN